MRAGIAPNSVLVASLDGGLMEMIVDGLSINGFDAHRCSNPEELAELVGSQDFSCHIITAQMFLQSALNIRRGSAKNVFFVDSGKVIAPGESFKAGALGVFYPPFSLGRMIQRVRDAIAFEDYTSQRSSLRISSCQNIILEPATGQLIEIVPTNISLGGVSLTSQDPLVDLTSSKQFGVQIPLPSSTPRKVTAVAELKWQHLGDTHQVGAAFTHIEDTPYEVFAAYFNGLITGDPDWDT